MFLSKKKHGPNERPYLIPEFLKERTSMKEHFLKSESNRTQTYGPKKTGDRSPAIVSQKEERRGFTIVYGTRQSRKDRTEEKRPYRGVDSGPSLVAKKKNQIRGCSRRPQDRP